MTAQTKLDAGITDIFESFNRTLPRKNRQVKRALDGARLLVADLLAKQAGIDGKIPKAKLSVVINGLPAIEAEIYRILREEMTAVLRDSAEYSATSSAGAIVTAVGIPVIAAIVGIAVTDAITTEVLFAAMVGVGIIDFITAIVSAAFNRKGTDGKRLNDRLRTLARILTDEISKTLRQSIQRGEGTSDILRKLERTFKDADNRVDTLVETESLFMLRQSIGKIAETSGIVKAVRIVDFPHGEPGYHERHKCYEYSHADEHGMGAGIYLVGTRKVRNPHPRCRAILQLVLIDDLT